jgi:hypothetical protein
MRLAEAGRRQLAWHSGDGGGSGGSGSGAAAPAPAAGAGACSAGAREGSAAAAAAAVPAALTALINTRDSDGESALRYAARGGHPEAVALLLGLGADPHSAAHDGRLPVDEAEEEAVVALLRAAMDSGSGSGGEDEGGMTAA